MFKHCPVADFERLFQKEQVYLGAVPTTDSLKALQEQGVRRLISVQHPDETIGDPRSEVESLGLEFFQFPISHPDHFSDPNILSIRKMLGESEQFPVLFHCSGAVRVSAVWIVFRVLDQNVDFMTAFEETQGVCPVQTVWHQAAWDYISRQNGENSG